MRYHDYLWLGPIDCRHDPLGSFEDLADAFAHLGDDLLRRHPPRIRIIFALSFHHEAMTRLEQLIPANASRLRAQHLRRLGWKFLDYPEEAARRPQPQVQLVIERVTCLERYGTVSRRDTTRAQ